MSSHEGVSCDSCLKSNFRGRRYKCLICYDYDLCAACYEAGATNTRHTTDHPLQCILTRADFDLYYGGEALANPDQSQSYTCPFCGRMGFTEAALYEHVTSEHADTSCEVVCPMCAGMPGGDPNLMTDDFAGHLAVEHHTGPRDLISFLDEPVAARHSVRRAQNSTNLPRGGGAAQSSRARRSNMHFSSSGLSSLSPSSRDPIDPIAELLSQLSGVRRSTSNTNTSTPTQLHQLQMQLQMERQQVNQARQQLERLPRRQNQSQTGLRDSASVTFSSASSLLAGAPASNTMNNTNTQTAANVQNQFLLSRIEVEEPNDIANNENEDCFCEFMISLITSTMTLDNQYKRKEMDGEKIEASEMVKREAETASATVKASNNNDAHNTCSANNNADTSVPIASRDGHILRGRARSKLTNIGRGDTSKSKDAK